MILASTANPRTQKLESKGKQLYIKAVVHHFDTTEEVEIAMLHTVVLFCLQRRLQSLFSCIHRALRIGFQRKPASYPKQDTLSSLKSLLNRFVKISITLYRETL